MVGSERRGSLEDPRLKDGLRRRVLLAPEALLPALEEARWWWTSGLGISEGRGCAMEIGRERAVESDRDGLAVVALIIDSVRGREDSTPVLALLKNVGGRYGSSSCCLPPPG